MTAYTYYLGDGLGNYDTYYRVANDGLIVEHALATSTSWSESFWQAESFWQDEGWDLDGFLEGRREIPELDVPVTLLALKDTK